jgi:hypothetical protein
MRYIDSINTFTFLKRKSHKAGAGATSRKVDSMLLCELACRSAIFKEPNKYKIGDSLPLKHEVI